MNIRKTIIIILSAVLAFLAVIYFAYSSKESAIKPEHVTVIQAPEQSGPMNHPAFYIEEYVPIVPEGENIALDAKITANGFQDVYTPVKVKDGNTKGNSYWEAAADTYPNFLTAQLKQLGTIHAVRLRLCPDTVWGKREQEIEIRISLDGENYDTLIQADRYVFDPNKGNEVIITFDGAEALYVQLVITDNTGATGGQIAEFEIYSMKGT